MHKVWCPSGHVLTSLQKLPAVCGGWLRSEKAVTDLSIIPCNLRVKKGQSRLWVRSDAGFGVRLEDFRFFTWPSLLKVSRNWDESHPHPRFEPAGRSFSGHFRYRSACFMLAVHRKGVHCWKRRFSGWHLWGESHQTGQCGASVVWGRAMASSHL